MPKQVRLCDLCGREIKNGHRGHYCSNECFEKDAEPDEDTEFECCSNCDLPDACSDFGCAIEQGIKKSINF